MKKFKAQTELKPTKRPKGKRHIQRDPGTAHTPITLQRNKMERPAWLDQAPPKGYVAGVGRGATGFSTRGDKSKNKDRNNNGTGARVPVRQHTPNGGEDNTAFADAAETEAAEAQRVFSLIDAKRNGQGKAADKPGPTADKSGQFAALKRDLEMVSAQQWLSLPAASDMTRRNKRLRLEEQLNRKTYAAPDSLAGGTLGGDGASARVDLARLTADREKLLQKSLDAARPLAAEPVENPSAPVETQNPDGEETARQRVLLRSYRRADPRNANAWLAAAQLEERCGRGSAARRLLAEACAHNPHSAELWLESVRVHALGPENDGKSVVAAALRFLPRSEALWLRAAELEARPADQYRVVRRALERVPESERLWELAVALEGSGPGRARVLAKALEFVPRSFALWRTLAEAQMREGDCAGARQTLNRARKALSGDASASASALPRVWVLALRVEERADPNVPLERLCKMLRKGLGQCDNAVSFEGLLKIAREVEGAEPPSPRAVEAVAAVAVERAGKLAAEPSVDSHPPSLTKLFCLKHAALTTPHRLSLWVALRDVCEKLGRMDALYTSFDTVLFASGQALPPALTKLALVYAKVVWQHDEDVSGALRIVDRALALDPSGEHSSVLLAAKVKLLGQAGEYDAIGELFRKHEGAVRSSPSLLYKQVNYLRFRGDTQSALDLLQQCIGTFPNDHKFRLQLSQLHESEGELQQAHDALSEGIKVLQGQTGDASNLALLYTERARLEEVSMGKPTRARATLDLALSHLSNGPGDSDAFVALTVARARLEVRAGNDAQARLLVDQALQRAGCAGSAALWAERLALLPPTARGASARKTAFRDALRATQSSAPVLLAVGRSLYADAQYAAAAKWCERAARAEPLLGDAWLWWARAESALGAAGRDPAGLARVQTGVAEAEPVHGAEWTRVSKAPATQYLAPGHILQRALSAPST